MELDNLFGQEEEKEYTHSQMVEICNILQKIQKKEEEVVKLSSTLARAIGGQLGQEMEQACCDAVFRLSASKKRIEDFVGEIVNG